MADQDQVIETSVDENVKTLEQQLQEIQDQLKAQREIQAKEREEKQREEFYSIVGGPSDVVSKLDLDWDDLDSIGVIGFTLQQKPDPDGGEPVTSIEPVFKRAAKSTSNSTASSSNGGGGAKRDLKALFEQHATAEDREEMDRLVAEGADGNKIWALRNKVATNAGFPR